MKKIFHPIITFKHQIYQAAIEAGTCTKKNFRQLKKVGQS